MSNGKSNKESLPSNKVMSHTVANTPRVGVKAKNSSIISKNNSSYSDKRYENSKVEDKDSAISKSFSIII
jgi:hypothetical protein